MNLIPRWLGYLIVICIFCVIIGWGVQLWLHGTLTEGCCQ